LMGCTATPSASTSMHSGWSRTSERRSGSGPRTWNSTRARGECLAGRLVGCRNQAGVENSCLKCCVAGDVPGLDVGAVEQHLCLVRAGYCRSEDRQTAEENRVRFHALITTHGNCLASSFQGRRAAGRRGADPWQPRLSLAMGRPVPRLKVCAPGGGPGAGHNSSDALIVRPFGLAFIWAHI
jgi:hypothetical protein